ncbi:MAG: hypothetical protein LBI27_08070 [Clostridiales bacterium]|nr:hypothetical protein [Clostridiales bacterium]
MFSFKLSKPKNLESTLKHLEGEVKKNNGNFSGDTKKGAISFSGIKGEYIVNENDLEIIITESKYPEFIVKRHIKTALI